MRPRFLFSAVAVVAGLAAFHIQAAGAGHEANPAVADSAPAVSAETVVYYFHGNVRCATCKKIEAYADEAVHEEFGKALEDGSLQWQVVNIDEPANRHFIQDFQLVTRSVVLVEYRDGKVVRFENLDQVWQLVRDKERFVTYVKDATREFLAAG